MYRALGERGLRLKDKAMAWFNERVNLVTKRFTGKILNIHRSLEAWLTMMYVQCASIFHKEVRIDLMNMEAGFLPKR